jgi:hypothetical protein
MRGPMDDAIPTEPGGDKAQRRLQEFLEQRYPGGIPPESSPLEEKPSGKPAGAATAPRRKRPKKRKGS